MMGWRLTFVTLLSALAAVHGRPSLLGSSGDGGHHGEQHGDHQENARQQATNAVTVVSVSPVMLHLDGSYSYRYDLSDGTFAFANALAGGEVTGGFGYKDTEGQDVAVDWVAGKVGFVPSGAHLGDGIGGAAQSLSSDYDYSGDYIAEPYSYVDDSGDYAAEPYVHEEIPAEAYVHEDIAAEPYVHQEEPYVYQDEPYIHKEIEAEPYIHQDIAAEAYSGEGNDDAFSSFGQKMATQSSPSNLASHSIQVPSSDSGINGNYYFEYKSDDASRVEDGVDGVVSGSYAYRTAGGNDINVQYTAGSQTGFVIENADELAAALENAANEPTPVNAKPYSGETAEVEFVGPIVDPETWEQDQSFRFGFAASDHSRNEESDANGNVRGSYNFRNEHGEDIEVRYIAGAETGFVVENLDEVLAKSAPQESNQIGSASNNIAVQSSPLSNNIQSTREFTAPPLSIGAPAGLYGAPAAPSAPLPSYNEPLPAPISQPDTLYGAPSESLPSYNEPEAAASALSPAVIPMMIMNPNYNFAYSNDDSSRTEDANPDTGIITGQYSYINQEGNEIEVKYRAGADIGFVIENQEDLNAVLLKATEDGAAAVRSNSGAAASVSTSYADPLPIAASSPDFISAPFPQPDTGYAAPFPQPDTGYAAPPSQPDTLYGAPSLPSYNDNVAAASSPAATATGMVMDASFNFAVEEDDHSFQEEADVNGERTGSYSYTNPDGEEVEVRYRAGRDGFVILNPEDVLPQAPVHNV